MLRPMKEGSTMKVFTMLKRALDKLLEDLIFALMLIMCVVVLWQVVARFVLHSPSVWSEELARYCMVWIAMLGSALAMKNGMHMTLTIITDRIKHENLRIVIFVFDMICCLILGFVLMYYGYGFMISGLTKATASLKISMVWANAAMPFGGLFLTLNIIEVIYMRITKKELPTGTPLN